MSGDGELGGRSLRDILVDLAADQSTGILTVQDRREIVAISLLEGEAVSADALNQPFEEGLGRVLTEREMVSPEDFAVLVAEHQAGGGRVVDLLVERGLLDRSELLTALRDHTYRLCRQALTWQGGECKFYQGDEVSFEEGVTPLPIVELLGRAARDLRDASLAAGDYPRRASIYARSSGTDSSAIGGEELGLWEALDGTRSVSEASEISRMPLDRVRYQVLRWELEGRVRAVGARPDAVEVPTSAELLTAPPPPEPRAPRKARASWLPWRRRGPRAAPDTGPWPARLAGLGLLAWLAATLVLQPSQVLAPFPWQGPHFRQVEHGLRDAQLAKIRRAAMTFFLLSGRFPEEGSAMVELGLLAPRDLVDPAGLELHLLASAVSYVVRFGQAGDDRVEAAWTGSLHGNFLLDPDFATEAESRVPPLVLLD